MTEQAEKLYGDAEERVEAVLDDAVRDSTGYPLDLLGQVLLDAIGLRPLLEENDGLRTAILDIDAHATPYGDIPGEPGFVGRYLVSAGALHRALGKVGHSAPEVTERTLALEAINDERDRQDAKWGGPEHDDHHTPTDWSAFLSLRVTEYRLAPDEERRGALLTEIGALAVAALESELRKVMLGIGDPV